MTVNAKGLTVVAALADIIRSKEKAGRDKDRATLPLLSLTLQEADRG